MAFELRDYQKKTLEELEAHLAFDNKAIITAPGGSGKSILIAEFARQKAEEGENIVILTNISALIPQLAKHLDIVNIKYNIVKSGIKKAWDNEAKITLIMEQSFHEKKRKELSIKCDILLKDEGHIGINQKRYEDIVRHLSPNKTILYTFTPYNEQGYLLENHTSDMLIRSVTIDELTKQGYLAPIKYFVPRWSEKVDYDELKISGNDYSEKDIENIINTNEYIDLTLKAMNALNAKNKKTLVYAASIKHADAISEALRGQGYSVGIVHSKLDKKHNEDVISSFKGENQGLVDNEIMTIVSVSSLTVGFDAPNAQLLVLLRKSMVRRLMQQIVARISRPHPDYQYKEVLDLAQYINTHGFLHEEDHFNPPPKGDKEALVKEKSKLEAPIVGSIVGEEPTEVTREIINVAVDELKSREKQIPELDMKTLTDMFELATEPRLIIEIGFEVHRRVHKSNYNEGTIEWATKPWIKFIEDFPQYERRIIKTMKSRIKNIVRDGKKIVSIHYMPDSFLRSQEPYTYYPEEIPF